MTRRLSLHLSSKVAPDAKKNRIISVGQFSLPTNTLYEISVSLRTVALMLY